MCAATVSVSSDVHPSCPAGRHCSLGVTPSLLALPISSSSLPRGSLEGGSFDDDIPRRAECSQVSPTLPVVELWVSVLSHCAIEYREAELVPDLKLQDY